MDPRAEAAAQLDGRYDVRVLEPSPPASSQEPFFADDPVAVGDREPGRPLVSPIGNGDLRWIDVGGDDAALAAWCAARWLGPYPALVPVPDGLATTRAALHQLAEHVIAPARRAVNGKIGLRYTRAGFGTPFFGHDVQIRVQDGELVMQEGTEERRAPITSLAAAVVFLGGDTPDGDPLSDEPLAVDVASARFLGDFYGFAASVLEELRATVDGSAEPSRVQLWPEHFDLSVELGPEASGARAGYGCSPGDEAHPEPYCYVSPWQAPPAGPLWGATAFTGAELPYAQLLAAEDPRATALAFFTERLTALTG